MDYAQGQAIGWIVVLYYIFPVLFLYPILLIASLFFKWSKFRKIITIISFPVLPLFFYYPFSTITRGIFQLIFPDYLSANVGDIFISGIYIEFLFSFITLGFVFYLVHLYKNKKTKKLKKTLIIYGILFVLFIVLNFVNAFVSKNLYAKDHSLYSPYIGALIREIW